MKKRKKADPRGLSEPDPALAPDEPSAPEEIAALSVADLPADGAEVLIDAQIVDESDVAEANDTLPATSDERGVVLYDPLRRYLAEIRNIKPLTAEEEHALAVRLATTDDRDAAIRLTTSHLRLVVRIAFEFKRSWLNLLDLIQEGNVGLLLAIRKFDPYRGIRLSTYAAWWIRAYMIKFLLDNWRMVKVGTTNARRKLLFNLRKEKDKLEALGIQPHPRLLAERMNVSEEDVIEVDRSLGVPDTSLEAPVGGDGELAFGDTLASGAMPVDQQVEERERQDIFKQKLAEFEKSLGPRERVVFRQRMLAEDPATLQELGERYQMTREGLRQVEKRITRDLKEFLRREIQDFRALDLTPPAGLPTAAAPDSPEGAARTALPAPPGTPALPAATGEESSPKPASARRRASGGSRRTKPPAPRSQE